MQCNVDSSIMSEGESVHGVFEGLGRKNHEIVLVDLDNIPERVDLTKPLIARRIQDDDEEVSVTMTMGVDNQRLYEVYALLKKDEVYEHAIYRMDRDYDQ